MLECSCRTVIRLLSLPTDSVLVYKSWHTEVGSQWYVLGHLSQWHSPLTMDASRI